MLIVEKTESIIDITSVEVVWTTLIFIEPQAFMMPKDKIN